MSEGGREAERSRYVQYGAGDSGPATWRNFDASPTLRIQRLPLIGSLLHRGLLANRPVFSRTVEYGDIVKGLPVASTHCHAVYCSHVLEHLALEDCRIALRHTLDYLRPGGIFRMVLPDLRALVSAYVDYRDTDAAHRFMERACLGLPMRPKSLPGRIASAFGNSAHLWMWDYESMSMELERAGFVEVRRAVIGDSAEPRCADVEEPGRWSEPGFDGGTLACLGIECRRHG